jgi:hypothetical protein
MFLQGAYGLALAGTGSFSSTTMHCQSCLPKVHRDGALPSAHQRVGAALLHPDFRAVIPLMPEPRVPQEGLAKNAGERKAAQRFLLKRRQAPPQLNFIVTEASLRATAPPLETLHAHGCPSLLGGKAGDPASLCHHVQAAARI